MLALGLLSAGARGGEEPAPMDPETRKALETVKARMLAGLLESPPSAERAREARASLQAGGLWKDIDYASKDPARWRAAEHLSRVRTLALAARHPDSPLKGDAETLAAARTAFAAWFEKDPQSSNWWWNQIGAPRSVYEIHLLLEEALDEKTRNASFEVQKRAKLGMTGANLIWVANITLARGCLSGDAAVVRAAVDAIAKEIRISSGEGVQIDYSFHQHGAQLYNGGYGLAYVGDGARIAALIAGTPFAFSKEKIELLSRYMLEGQQWMTRGANFDYSAIGRELVRPGHSAKALLATCRHLASLETPDKPAFLAFADRMEGKPGAAALEGNRLFWRSDYMTHPRKDWYASVRAASARLIGTELVNGENQLGGHLFEGVFYLMRSGEEYRDIFPVWDWASLPGVTADHGLAPAIKQKNIGTPFAGGASDGRSGAFGLMQKSGELAARKAWFFFDDAVACLGAGITQGKPAGEIRTTVNQCLAQGEAACNGKALTGEAQDVQGPAWVFHDGVAYVFPQACDLSVRCGDRKGDWKRISTSLGADPVTKKVFLLALRHGKEPKDAGYAYFVAPGLDAAAAARFAEKPGIEALSTTPACLAVRHAGQKLIQAVFFEKGSLKAGALTLSVDRPCALLCQEAEGGWQVTGGSPAHETGALKVRFEQEGKSAEATLDLPTGDKAGSSVRAKLNF
ncbi:MAG: hypothetical protein KIS92_01255 [Planctomycetota bacterium]|nr:hypothetical protein [Planctomycetota bacterium]